MGILAITGSIGAGKTTVSTLATDALTQHGECVHVLSLDQLAKELTEENAQLKAQLAGVFGDEILRTDGSLDRANLAVIAFADENSAAKLNELTHPPVAQLAKQILEENELEQVATILESPFPLRPVASLFEGSIKDAEIWTVHASREVRIKRACAKGLSGVDVLRRMECQPEEDAYLAEASAVIENEGSIEDLRKVVLQCLSSSGWLKTP